MSTVIAAFSLYFLVLGSYFAVRPVREKIATLLGREYVADLWLYTAPARWRYRHLTDGGRRRAA